MEAVIDLRRLVKRFGGTPAVDGLSLSVPRGAIFALLGDNGAGKTTTIRMLTGLLRPDGGRASVLNLDSWEDAVTLRRRVGYVPERPRYYDWMSVGEVGWFTSGFHPRGFLPRYLELVGGFELNPKAKLKNLSKGQYAKVGLALALASDPEVLILDEPTSGLDLLVRREFLRSMVDMAGNGRTILISSHQIAEVERIASHVAFVAKGKLLLAAPLEELRQRVVKLRLHFDRYPPDEELLGTVLQRNGSGRHWQAILLDPNRDRVAALHHEEGIRDLEETPLSLEDLYCALLAKPAAKPLRGRQGAWGAAAPRPETDEEGWA